MLYLLESMNIEKFRAKNLLALELDTTESAVACKTTSIHVL